MKKELKFDSKSLLLKKFHQKEHGYDPYEVDLVIDEIIEDYKLIESLNQVDVDKLIQEISNLRQENDRLSAELEKEKKKMKYLPKDQKDFHIDNFELLQRVGKLEAFIHEKLNVNPDEIK